MGKILAIFTLFVMVVSTTASIAHTHIDLGSASNAHISIDVDVENDTADHEPVSNGGFEMGCNGGYMHYLNLLNANLDDAKIFMTTKQLITPNTHHFYSGLVYSLKRPPKA